MKQYIDKGILVAEIERRIKVSQDYAKCNLTESTKIGNQAQLLELNDILSFLNTLEVKEVDLEKEIASQYEANYEEYLTYEEFADIAKYFYELGLKAQKGEEV